MLVYRLIRFLLIGVVGVGLFATSVSSAQELSIYDEGLSEFSDRNFDLAAQQWGALANRLERLGSQDDIQLKRSAFAHVLATVAYEKDNDSRAYDNWSSAVRLYEETLTKWDDQRRVITKRLEKLVDEGYVYTTEELKKNEINSDDHILLKMQDVMSLGYYDGPRAGLAHKRDYMNNIDEPFYNKPSLFDGY